MPKEKLFYWRGKNRFQQQQRGVIIAQTALLAEQMLFQRGLQQIKLQRNWQLRHRINHKEICALLTQLATLLKATIPLNQSLHLLWQHCENLALYAWLKLIITDIENGYSFSQALSQHQSYFTAQEQQLIKAGEMTGQLVDVCQQIALQRQQQLRLQQKVQKILVYPIAVLLISLLLTLLLLWFIVPQFAQMYDEQTDLPMFTQLLLSFSHYLHQYGLMSLLIILILGGVIHKALKSSLWFYHQKIKCLGYIPLFNRLLILMRTINFCQALGLMLQAGLPIQQALQSFLPLSINKPTKQIPIKADPILANEAQHILQSLQQGYCFSESINEGFLPQQALKMLQIGEKSGKMVFMLQQVTQYYREQLEHKLDLLAQLLEPLLMLIIGSVIAIIMLGMYLPLFNMGNIL
ncbi:type II secretion system F family protein [Volucribacter amazonae]|uniref:Type II secretion system protein F n=1 Tax=Volucribacter amazonae TaxID=256731 RepID=A0A9X4SIR3_9PAST|nr:type II secretion system F family protein [Volucribacter amazonae]MDG6895917.1 type II secretion system protein F [Volucribacter amazonae]